MTADLQIRSLSPSAPEWIEFIQSFPDATIFHHPSWIKTLALTYQYNPSVLVAVDSMQNIQAGIPLLDVKSILTGRQLISLPFTDHCAPLFNSDDALKVLLDHLQEENAEQTYKNIEVRWKLPEFPQLSQYVHFGLFIIDLPPTTEEAFYNIQKRTRKHIKNAQRSELVVKMGQSLDMMREFYKLQTITRKKHGVPVQPWRFFKEISNNIIQQDLGSILLAYYGNTCVAGKVTLRFQDTLTFKYSASREDFQDENPNYLLTWRAIEWAVENGYKKIDMGRCETSNEGLRRYKRKWGSNESPLTYSTFGNVPASVSENKLMETMKVIIQHSPKFICKAAGEILYKHSA